MSDVLVLAERVRNAIGLGEGHFQEFKSAFEGKPEQKRPRRVAAICADIGEALAAFANADGGSLLIGVEDDGEVTGVPHNDDDVTAMLAAPRTHVHPKSSLPLAHAARLSLDGREVLFFSVTKGTTQIYQLPDGRCVRRVGIQTLPESIDAIIFDRQESKSRGYDSEFVDEAQVSDLDLNLLREIAEHYLPGITPEKYLQQIGLAEYAGNGLRLRRAALLLFALKIQRWHPRSQVRILRVHGATLKAGAEYNVASDELVSGNVLELLRRSWEALRPSLVYRTEFGSDTRFEQRYLFPEWACREALVNAIAHRDYSAHNGIDCFIFDDRMEIKSPGALLSTLSVERLKKLDGAHESRNALLARALREAGYLRELGEGMKRIFQLMEESDLQKPELQSDSTSFTVTLYQRSVFTAQQLAWLSMFDGSDLSKLEQRIVIAGMHERALAPQDIYRALNNDDRDTYDREVTQLRKRGLLVEIRTNSQATLLAKKSGKPKSQIPRFKVVNPGRGTSTLAPESLAKVVVFGLPVDVMEEELQVMLTAFGAILRIDLPPAHPDHVTRIAFATFADAASAVALCSGERRPTIRGNSVRIERFDPRRSAGRQHRTRTSPGWQPN
jgi:ATP-dependent DNA helicase RecG